MIHLTDKFFAIPMPEGAECCELRGAHPERPNPLLSFYGEGEAVELPAGQYQIIVFNTGAATEEDARKIVDSADSEGRGLVFINYENGMYIFSTAKSSLRSLLRAKGCDQNKNYAVIQKTGSDE